MKEKFTFFWDGPFSQWHNSPFEINGVKYNCGEQYMMAEKARLFGDKEAEDLIMSSSSPREQKAIGRTVANFNENQWNKVCKEVVHKGNLAKFTQNPDLQEILLATKGTTIVEASPYDKIWGIGLHESDPRCQDRSTWQGTNWLGEILTKVRNEIYEHSRIAR